VHSVQALLVLLVGHTRHLAQTLAVFANGVPPLNVLLKKEQGACQAQGSRGYRGCHCYYDDSQGISQHLEGSAAETLL